MGFFDRDANRGASTPAELTAPRGVPLAAQARLSRTASTGVFTSTLSAREYAMLSGLGPRPVAQVLGASVYQIGWQNLPSEAQWGGDDFSCPLWTVNAAWSEARRLAFSRLAEEAAMVGADAVVGVHLRRGEQDWARRTVDLVVSGTAIRRTGATPAGDGRPALSDLSVQDFWKLQSSGCEPAGIVASTYVMFVSQGRSTRWRRLRSTTSNQELSEFSDGFSDARHGAISGLRDQARKVGADGVVGVSLSYDLTSRKLDVDLRAAPSTGLSVQSIALGGESLSGGADKREGMVFTVHAAGTAIRRLNGTARPAAGPTLTLDLNSEN